MFKFTIFYPQTTFKNTECLLLTEIVMRKGKKNMDVPLQKQT